MLRLATAELRYQLNHLAAFYLALGGAFFYVSYQASTRVEILRHPRIALAYLIVLALLGSLILIQVLRQTMLEEKRGLLQDALPFGAADRARADLMGAGLTWLPLPLFNAACLAAVPLGSPAEEFWLWIVLANLSLVALVAQWLLARRLDAQAQKFNAAITMVIVFLFLAVVLNTDLLFLEKVFAYLSSPVTALLSSALVTALLRRAPRPPEC